MLPGSFRPLRRARLSEIENESFTAAASDNPVRAMVSCDVTEIYKVTTNLNGDPSSFKKQLKRGQLKIHIGEHWREDKEGKKSPEDGSLHLGGGWYKVGVLVST
jgi:hypothetical protein